jgi:hypothetical protein
MARLRLGEWTDQPDQPNYRGRQAYDEQSSEGNWKSLAARVWSCSLSGHPGKEKKVQSRGVLLERDTTHRTDASSRRSGHAILEKVERLGKMKANLELKDPSKLRKIDNQPHPPDARYRNERASAGTREGRYVILIIRAFLQHGVSRRSFIHQAYKVG